MPNLKAVYFAPDGKFFDSYQECYDYEETEELIEFIHSELELDPIHSDIREIINLVKTRYTIKERYDYVKPISDISTEELPSQNPPEDF
jgi:hypothetical protein